MACPITFIIFDSTTGDSGLDTSDNKLAMSFVCMLLVAIRVERRKKCISYFFRFKFFKINQVKHLILKGLCHGLLDRCLFDCKHF